MLVGLVRLLLVTWRGIPISRVIFAAFPCYLDDTNGAAIASQAMMEALARHGIAVEVLCSTMLGWGREVDLGAWLAARGGAPEAGGGDAWTGDPTGIRPEGSPHWRLIVRGVPITLIPGSTRPHEPDEREVRDFLQTFAATLERFRPDVVVSYGGSSLSRAVLKRAKVHGVATVFPLHNLRYRRREPFDDADAVLVASEYAAEHYRRTLGLQCVVLPNLVDPSRVVADDREPRYVVFVNPTIEKGAGVFARIADELGRRRPDIPLLVVESLGTEADLVAFGLDLRAHGNVFLRPHTPDPRRFWRLARLALLPSLVAENQPLVAIEAMLNGVPVLGSDRGGVPEVLGAAGTVLPIPPRLHPDIPELPTPEEVAPWVAAILRLWDDPAALADLRRRALAESRRWAPETLEPRYARFFADLRSTRLSSNQRNF